MSYNGFQFSTGNSTINNLPVGSVLEVVGPGQVEVVEVAKKPAPQPGDRINTKYGKATVVGLSSRFGDLEGFDPETQVLYIADGSHKVRRFTF